MTTSRTPQRRLGAIVGMIVACAIIGVLSMREAWYLFRFQSPVITLPNLQSFSGASASRLLSGWDLTSAGTSNGVNPSAMSNIGAIPTPLVLIVASALFALFAWRARSTMFAIVGVGTAWFAHQSVAAAAASVENPLSGGQYMSRLDAMNRFDLVCLSAIALCGVLAAQIVVVRRAERSARIDAGEDVEPTLGETLGEVHIGRILRNLSELSHDRPTTGQSPTGTGRP